MQVDHSQGKPGKVREYLQSSEGKSAKMKKSGKIRRTVLSVLQLLENSIFLRRMYISL